MQREGRVSVVVECSRFGESCERALESVRAFEPYSGDVHFVFAGNAAAADAFGAKHKVHAVSTLRPSDLACAAVVRIPADVVCTREAAERLVLDMRQYAGSYDHYAVSSATVLEDDQARVWSSLAYGFLLVLTVFDTMRFIATLGRLHRSCDVRGTILYRTYPNSVQVPAWRWWVWWIFTRISPARFIESACAQVPSPQDQGWRFVRRSIYNHSAMGFGLWMVGFAAYYYVYAIPWWVGFASHYYDFDIPWFAEFSLSWPLLASHAPHTLLVAYVAHQWIVTPHAWLLALQVVLYPIYLTFFPLFFLFARFWPLRTHVAAVTTK